MVNQDPLVKVTSAFDLGLFDFNRKLTTCTTILEKKVNQSRHNINIDAISYRPVFRLRGYSFRPQE